MYRYKEININSIQELVPIYIETFNAPHGMMIGLWKQLLRDYIKIIN